MLNFSIHRCFKLISQYNIALNKVHGTIALQLLLARKLVQFISEKWVPKLLRTLETVIGSLDATLKSIGDAPPTPPIEQNFSKSKVDRVVVVCCCYFYLLLFFSYKTIYFFFLYPFFHWIFFSLSEERVDFEKAFNQFLIDARKYAAEKILPAIQTQLRDACKHISLSRLYISFDLCVVFF